MILKKIYIHNIASIEDAEIDFTSVPIRDADLFLIHGETGAGKSTLIDAICLALYKNTPRLKSAPTGKLQFGNYALTSQDSANMLRHGTTDGEAKLDFEGNDHQSYTAVWSAHRTPSAITVRHYLLRDSAQIAEGRVVGDLIKTTILGMDFDDFCRTAILAQGEFTRFLKCDDKEKSKILEKLTGTEYFSSVGKMIYTIWKEKNEAYTKLSSEVEGIRMLTAEELESIEKEIAEAEAQCATIDSEIGRYTSYKDWLVADKKYLETLQQMQQKYEQVLLLCESLEYREEAKMLGLWDKSQQAISDYKERLTQKKACEECLKAERELSARYSKALSGVAFIRQQLVKDQDHLQNLSRIIEQYQPHKEMLEKSAAVVAWLENAARIKAQIAKNEKLHKELVSKESEFINAEKNAIDENEKVQAEIAAAKQQVSLQAQQVAKLNPEKVNEEMRQLNDRRELLYNASSSLKELQQAISEDEKNRAALSEAQKTYQQNADIEKQLLDNMNSAKQSFDVADRVLHSINMATEDWAVKVRSALNDGDKCPVCGNIYSALHFDEMIGSLQDGERKKYDEAKQNYESAAAAYNKKQSEQNLLLKSIDSMVVESNRLGQKRTDAFQQAKGFFAQLGFDLVDGTQESYNLAIEEGRRLKSENKAAEEENSRKNAEIINGNKLLGQLNAALQSKIEKGNNSMADVAAAQKTLEKCRSDIKAAAESIANMSQQASELLAQADVLITWPNWKADWERDAKSFVDRMKDEAKEFRSALDDSAKVTSRLERLRSEVSLQEQQLDTVSQFWPHWGEFSVSPVQIDDIALLCSRLTTDSATLVQRRNQAHSLLEGAESRLAEYYSQHTDISEEVLVRLVAFDAPSVRSKHGRQDQELSSYKGQLEVGQKQLSDHHQNQPWGLEEGKDIPYYESVIASWGGQRSEFAQKIGAKKKELADNEHHIREHGEKLVQLQQQKIVLDQWAAFCERYGDLEGGKFRRLAQQLVFDRLLQLANQQLARLNGRYRLETIPKSLAISLRDQYVPDFCSPVFNLSGGESFMVSLSLALALSNMGREGIAMDTLFIDEGFGTLSPGNQEKVMDLLQTLQHEQGKRVGIISHVPYLLERIPTQIKVERIDGTRSKVTVSDVTR